VHLESDGRLTQTFSHAKFGDGTWLIDPQTLRSLGTIHYERTPPELGKVENTFSGLTVRWAEDSGDSGKSDSRYVLRWETLDENRDRPRTGELPPPSMLRLCEIQTTAGISP
jgi:hypothetical protein